MPPVEVFKTNVARHSQAQVLVQLLSQNLPGCKINFDLEDCDRILRVEGKDCLPGVVIELVQRKGFFCQVLEE